MRNLKKILALVLALMMVVSVMVVASAASFNDYDDVDEIDSDYAEAVEVLTNMGVFRGFDGGFQPDTKVTRAEVATLVYRILTADVTDKNVGLYEDYNYFTDVNENNWFAGYVNYAANGKYVVGVGEDRYDPQGNVTGYQLLVIMLRAIGYGKNSEFEGTSQWTINAATYAEQLGITDGLKTNLNKELTREEVAYVLFNAIQVDKVEYTTAFGYQNKPNETNIGYDEFGLEKTSGEITAVGRTAGTTTLVDHSTAANGTELDPVTVTGTNTPWTDIGYGAYVYTVATPGAKTRAAVSDLVITGESLKVTTDGTDYSAGISVEDDARIYFNGEYQGSLTTTGFWGRPVANTTLKNWIDSTVNGERGVKVDYIDNDNGGKAEVIVVTKYTTAEVSAITTADTTTGVQGNKEATTYLKDDTGVDRIEAVKESALVANEALAVGDWVTYVEYPWDDLPANTSGDYYVTKAASTVATYTSRTVSATAETYYTIGDSNYYISDLEYVTDVRGTATNYLSTQYGRTRGTTVTLYTDPYGYIVYVEQYVPASSYLYVLSNEDTNFNQKVTEAVVAFTDGTIATVNVDEYDGDSVFFWDDLANTMYSYTVNADGTYTLVEEQNVVVGGSYKNGTATVYGPAGTPVAGVDTATVVVDLRGVTSTSTAAKDVFTGYAQIPTVEDATIWYATVRNAASTGRTITYAFLLKNTNTVYQDFIVYQTTDYTEVVDNTTKNITSYLMDVVVDGAEVPDYELTPTQWKEIQKYGVGLYSFVNKSLTSYTAFNEVSGTVASWGNGAINVRYTANAWGGTNDVAHYTYDATDITVLSIGTDVNDLTPVVGGSYTVFVESSNGTSADHIYVIVDAKDLSTAVNTVGDFDHSYNAYPDQIKGGYTYHYETYKTSTQEDVTVCVGRTPETVTTPDDYLSSAVADGLEAKWNGKGDGSYDAPFQLVAQGSLEGVNETTLEVTAIKTADEIKIAYTVDDVDSAAPQYGFASDEYRTDVPAEDGNKWAFSINGVYFTVEVEDTDAVLQEAINKAVNGVVKLPAGTYSSLQISGAKMDGLTIDGQGEAVINLITVPNNGTIGDLTIKNCTIVLGPELADGSITIEKLATGGVVTITDCVFVAPEGTTAGSGVYLTVTAGAKYVITNNTFVGAFKDGAIVVDFKGNGYGGACDVQISGNDFTDVTGWHLKVNEADWSSIHDDIAESNTGKF